MNEFLVYMNEKLNKGNSLDPKAIGWSLMPKINALVRFGNVEDKEVVFNGFVGNVSKEEALKIANRCYRLQTTEVKRLVEELEPTIDHNHKAIICFGNKKDASLLGLVANKFCGKYNKPTIILRELNSTTWTGSLRSPVNLAEKINDSKLAEAIGHPSACGITIKKANLERFKDWLETLDLAKNTIFDVTAEVNPKDITLALCKEIENHKDLWGKGIESPKFYLKATLTQNNVFVFEKSMKTLKLNLGGLNCLKFFASDDDVARFRKYKEFEVELIIGDLSVNEYEGVKTPQCIIQKYEVHEINEDWDDCF